MSEENWTESQRRVVEEIRRVAAQLGVDRLSQDDFDRHHQIAGCSTAGYQFGSWNRAVAAAGLTPIPSGGQYPCDRKISDEDLLRDLLRIEAELGKRPSEREVARFGSYSPKPYKARWGSIANAVDVARSRFAERS